ncbi:MAG: hypothetical protein O2960_21305 [Verrucomicrobia bacterium]|nr:hypothetical protein [Verrucomicrobiota bacterium]
MRIPRLPLLILMSLFASNPTVSGSFVRPEPIPVDRLLKSAEAYRVAHPDSAEAHYTLARIHYLAFVRSSEEVPAFVPQSETLEGQSKPWIAQDWQLLPGQTPAIDERAFQLATEEVGFPQPHPRKEPEKFRRHRSAYDRHLVDLQNAEYRRSILEHWKNGNASTDEKAIAHATEALEGIREAIRLGLDKADNPRREGPPTASRHGLYELGLASLMEQFADWKQLRKPAGLPPKLGEIDHNQARDNYLRAFRIG